MMVVRGSRAPQEPVGGDGGRGARQHMNKTEEEADSIDLGRSHGGWQRTGVRAVKEEGKS